MVCFIEFRVLDYFSCNICWLVFTVRVFVFWTLGFGLRLRIGLGLVFGIGLGLRFGF